MELCTYHTILNDGEMKMELVKISKKLKRLLNLWGMGSVSFILSERLRGEKIYIYREHPIFEEIDGEGTEYVGVSDEVYAVLKKMYENQLMQGESGNELDRWINNQIVYYLEDCVKHMKQVVDVLKSELDDAWEDVIM